MPRFKNRTDEKYGRLTAISHAGKDQRGKHVWNCLCECGNKKTVCSDNLSSGKSKSCGCLKNEFLHNSGNQFKKNPDRQNEILKVQYAHMKRRNKKYLCHPISLEEFKCLVLNDCHYCGARPYKILQDRSCESKAKKLISSTVVFANGIDRVDNSIGYVAGNCVPCCKTCNSAKGELCLSDFKSWAKNLNRRFIGIERDDKYYEIAKNRILSHEVVK